MHLHTGHMRGSIQLPKPDPEERPRCLPLSLTPMSTGHRVLPVHFRGLDHCNHFPAGFPSGSPPAILHTGQRKLLKCNMTLLHPSLETSAVLPASSGDKALGWHSKSSWTRALLGPTQSPPNLHLCSPGQTLKWPWALMGPVSCLPLRVE